MNIDFMKEIIMTTDEYWVVARKTIYRENFDTKRGEDQILFIAIPKGIRRGLQYEEITLKDVETFYNSFLDRNIFLYPDYPPFQDYIPFRDVHTGFPIKNNAKEFLIKALELKSDNLNDYKALIENNEKEFENEKRWIFLRGCIPNMGARW